MSDDDSILFCVALMTVVDTGPDEHHRAIREMDNPRNQHKEMPQKQYTDKVADESVAVQRQVSEPPSTLGQRPAGISGMTNQVETPTKTSKAKP